jgi:peptidoglycan-associated lipoprotein
MFRTATTIVACALLATACAKKPVAREVSSLSTTGANVGNVSIDDELRRLCNVTFDNADRAPKFDYDEAALMPQDRDVLEQVAKCVTTGPLKGRKLALVGRADPRGETEYNMVLGDHRADAVHVYLARLGVGISAMSKTSRGELDAEGKDDDSWQRDRRVDIRLDAANGGPGAAVARPLSQE